jgi:hypothetical protein
MKSSSFDLEQTMSNGRGNGTQLGAYISGLGLGMKRRLQILQVFTGGASVKQMSDTGQAGQGRLASRFSSRLFFRREIALMASSFDRVRSDSGHVFAAGSMIDVANPGQWIR